MIRTKPSTPEYRDAWDRVFAPKRAVGDRVVWHGPKHWPSADGASHWECKCDQAGVITTLSNGYVTGVQLDAGGVIDPSIDPDLLQPEGAACPIDGRRPPLGASVD